jgi:subtilisin family serine protease
VVQASQWFQWLGDVHTRVYADNYGGKRVKIAVLDTGIELSNRQKEIYDHRKDMMYKSWIEADGEGIENSRDDVGHGTHVATTLARVAPNAIIHVAQVFTKRKPNMETELKNVAQVSHR